jgi:hypothetical protein
MTPDIHGRYYKFNNLYLGSRQGLDLASKVCSEKIFMRGDAKQNYDLRNYDLHEILFGPDTDEEKTETERRQSADNHSIPKR